MVKVGPQISVWALKEIKHRKGANYSLEIHLLELLCVNRTIKFISAFVNVISDVKIDPARCFA